jgi:hypothetical protein
MGLIWDMSRVPGAGEVAAPRETFDLLMVVVSKVQRWREITNLWPGLTRLFINALCLIALWVGGWWIVQEGSRENDPGQRCWIQSWEGLTCIVTRSLLSHRSF